MKPADTALHHSGHVRLHLFLNGNGKGGVS